ncbi:MAG: hypothetical protein C5B49_11745 [Bdellovibrio sp.]|nr:MAG: hypothetical protein C5B49_11745 [Bdellovibrio sp.]
MTPMAIQKKIKGAASKGKSRAPLKPAAKSSKPVEKSKTSAAAKAAHKATSPGVGKGVGKGLPKAAEKAKKESDKKTPAPPSKKKSAGKASLKPETKKKGKSFEEEDFLPEVGDAAEEDLPDLTEFEEDDAVEEAEEGAETEAQVEGAAVAASSEEVILTDAEGRRYCKVKDCDQLASVDGYCRYHYLLLWKKIQVRRKILADGKLERYVEELTARYPDKFLEMIRRDLKTEKDFLAAIAELEIDESSMDSEFEDEAQTYIDEVRGVSETGIGEEEEY